MSKVKKVCAYKGCTPTNDGNGSNETFFSFPSDPARCELWKSLSKTELAVPKYLCSKHFDKTKYISENPRRNILLNTAVPFPYDENSTDNKYLNDDTEIDNLIQLGNTIEFEDDDTTTNINTDGVLFEITEHNESDKNITYTDDSNIVKLEPCAKRKLSNITIPISSVKMKKSNVELPNVIINSNYNKEKPKLYNNNKISIDKIDNEKTTPATTTPASDSDSQITTFIFKGEEYIQMPKELYLNEKSELQKKVLHYENIVFGIQNFLEKESVFKG